MIEKILTINPTKVGTDIMASTVQITEEDMKLILVNNKYQSIRPCIREFRMVVANFFVSETPKYLPRSVIFFLNAAIASLPVTCTIGGLDVFETSLMEDGPENAEDILDEDDWTALRTEIYDLLKSGDFAK